MYIYRKSNDPTFGALELVPQHFYKFWDGDIDASDVGPYRKPLDSIPEINWEINLTAEQWRLRVANADPKDPIPMWRLREIPDSYIESNFLNLIYGYSMAYRTYRALYMQIRIQDSFSQDPIIYPGLALGMLGIKTLIEDARNEDTPVSLAKAETLLQLLRHITYVAVVCVGANQPVEPTGKVFISSLNSKVNDGSDFVFYDDVAYADWLARGGEPALAAAEWVLNQRNVDDTAITNKVELLERWKDLTDLTKP